MVTKAVLWNRILDRLCFPRQLGSRSRAKGQALVEFTLVFILLLVIIWIPADFGLAFMTGQLASNAAREGARIGSATTPFNASDIKTETCRRLPSALLSAPSGGSGTSCSPLSNAKVDVQLLPGVGSCNQTVEVTVSGNYNFFFYQLLHLMGVTGDLNSTPITRTTSMRWEHQC
jgi:Flp pilus assembly protein TadG